MQIQIAENIKKYRIARGYTQSELALLLSVSPQAVSRWENGQAFPDITFLPAVANIYETSIDMVFEHSFNYFLYVGIICIAACVKIGHNSHCKRSFMEYDTNVVVSINIPTVFVGAFTWGNRRWDHDAVV